jgi:hypothetical protein
VIALSWVLLAAAIGSLIYGLTREGLTFIYVSIGASVGAMLFLLGSILRKRPVQPATAGAPYGPPAGPEARRPAPAAAPATTTEPGTRPITPTPTGAPAATGPGRKTTRKKTTTRRASARKRATPTAEKTAAAEPSPAPGTVVALPERGTYHVSGCRFIKGKRDTEQLSVATAKRRGYNPCRVCKPGS